MHMKSIWEKIKLAFNRKPEGDIKLPQLHDLPKGTTVSVNLPEKKVRKPRTKKVVENKNEL